MDISIPYYEDNTRISNSNIGWFLNKGPAYLNSMLTGQAEGDSGAQLARGTMIHMYLLQPKEFHTAYVVWDKSRPSSTQQEKFCTELAESLEIEPDKALIEAYRASYRVSTLTDEKVLSKAKETALELKDYIDFLKQNDGRYMITPYWANQLMEIAENIHKHKYATTLLKNPYKTEDEELFHEFHINWEHNGVKCKSLLDSVLFNYKDKICTLMDLKTTVHIANFAESMHQYDYLRQLCYYTMALRWYIEHELGEHPDEWKFKWFIIGIDTTGTNEIRVFKFTYEQVISRLDTIEKALNDIKWHIETNKWDHTKEYYEGDGSETLSL